MDAPLDDGWRDQIARTAELESLCCNPEVGVVDSEMSFDRGVCDTIKHIDIQGQESGDYDTVWPQKVLTLRDNDCWRGNSTHCYAGGKHPFGHFAAKSPSFTENAASSEGSSLSQEC